MGKSHHRNKARRRHLTASAAKYLHRDSIPKPKEVIIMPRGFNTTTGPLLNYLEKRQGIKVTLPELVKELGLNEGQIRASLSYMRSKKFDIETVVTGQCWIYRAAPPSEVAEETPTPEINQLTGLPGSITGRLTPPVEPVMQTIPTAFPMTSPVEKPKFTMPKVDRDVEFFQVVSKSAERVILKDSEGRVYKATEI